jgi:phosphatidate phosphatase APP1
MKYFRLKDSSVWELFGSQEKYKVAIIEQILTDFPERRFVLIGDSGGQDPEIFASLARKHPEQVTRVFIRDTAEERADAERFKTAFADLPEKCCRVFRNAEELAEALE